MSITGSLNALSTGVNVTGQLASAVGLGSPSKSPTYWKDKLQAASFRGVPFYFLEGESEFGRETAVHKYPYRDGVWIEDLGRAARHIALQAYIVGDDCIAQRKAMIAACETAGEGDLVHPTLGRLSVCVVKFSASERWDRGRVFEFSFSFLEQGKRQFPSVATSTGTAVAAAAGTAVAAAQSDFLTSVAGALKSGLAVAKQAISTVQTWVRRVQNIVNDATNMVDFVESLPGQFGRYFGGSSIPGSVATPASATVASLMAAGLVSRSNVGEAVLAMQAAASGLAASTSASSTLTAANIVATTQTAGNNALQQYAVAAQAVAIAVSAAAATPADGLRILASLVGAAPALPAALAVPVYPVVAVNPTPTAQAVATMAGASSDLFRRVAVVALAQAASTYQPSSFDDAVAVQAQVTTMLDVEIEIAGDQGQDATYSALRALRTAVVNDIGQRGASLAPLTQVSTRLPIPSLVLAQRLYQDSTRSDQLVSAANPIHPAFMPTQFTALAE